MINFGLSLYIYFKSITVESNGTNNSKYVHSKYDPYARIKMLLHHYWWAFIYFQF